ncbi:MAG: ATP-dependent Clp protease ATP-binding subunit ClpX [bacterium]|nr:ATP-dependent Clp protease ATP-binding subunit ClpX [bacterium]
MANPTERTPKGNVADRCSFCNRPVAHVRMLIPGPQGAICDTCVKAFGEFIRRSTGARTAQLEKIPTPEAIKRELDTHVIGQELPKKMLSVAVYNHYKRVIHQDSDSGVEIDKSNVLLLGPTGTGKTLLAQSLAKLLQVPFVIADATTLTEAGYVGEDVENVLVRLYQAAEYDVALTEIGIIYIDEIDKISRKSESSSITRDVSGEGVQQALLKLLEGTIAAIPPEGGRKHPEQRLVHINTRNILFICGGAFEGIDKIIANRVGRNAIGFGAEIHAKRDESINTLLRQLQPIDLLRFGMIPELVGRLPVYASLEELSEEALLRILVEPKNAIIKQFQKLFELEGVRLLFEEEALQAIVHKAQDRKTGARALRSILEEVMLEWMFQLPSEPDLLEIRITADTVETGASPMLLRRSDVSPTMAQSA